MRRFRLFLFAVIVVLGAAIVLLLNRCSQTEPVVEAKDLPNAKSTATTQKLEPRAAPTPPLPQAPVDIVAIYNTPIVFYGRVQDQNGTAISNADIKVAVADRVGGGSSKLALKSDQAGFFTINSKGMSLHVRVSKERFDSVSEQETSGQRSHAGFDYGVELENGIHNPDPTRPVVFTLYRRSQNAPLLVVEEQSVTVPKTGSSVVVNLATNGGKLGREIILRCWTNDLTKEKDGRYDWKFEIEAKNGGVQERTGVSDFMAPSGGYKKVVTIDMPKALSRQEWDNDVEQSCWVKFNDQTFARIDVRMIAGGDHFATVKGYINAQAGSRILEVRTTP